MNKLSASAISQIDEIVKKHQDKRGPAKLMLHDVQRELGYIPFEAMVKIAEASHVSVAEVYGVVTFYSFFSLTPKGKYVIGCCLGTACYVKGAQQIIDKFCELLKINPGETTADGLFTIDALRCIGACGIAPAVSINGQVYPKLAVGQVAGIIDEYRNKEGGAN